MVNFNLAKQYTQDTNTGLGNFEQQALNKVAPVVFNPLNIATSFFGSLADTSVDSLKGLVDLGKALNSDRYGDDPGLKQLAESPVGDFIKSIPDHVAMKTAQDIGTFGQRENITQIPGGQGLLDSVPLVGMIASLPVFGAMSAGAGTTAGTVMDLLSGSPGATQAMNAVKTAPQMFGTLGGIGAGSMVLPGIHYNTDPNTGNINAGGVGQAMLAGGIAGIGLGGVAMAPQLAKQGKQVLDDIVKGATGMIKQSDDMQIVKQINQRQLERQQMEAFTKVATEQMDTLPPPRVPEPVQPKVDEVLSQPEQEQYVNLIDEQFKQEQAPLEEELNTITSFIEEAKAKPIEVTDKEINEKLEIPYKKKDILNEIRESKKTEIKAEKDSIKKELDTALEQQLLLKEKEANLNKLRKEKTEEELNKEFNKPFTTVEKQLVKEIETSEKAIGKIQKRLAQVDSRLEKTLPVQKAEYEAKLQEVEAQRNKVREEVFTAKQTEQQKLVQDLEKEAETVFGKYEKARQDYEQGLSEFGTTPQQRLVASKEGIKEISADGVETPIIETKEAPTTLTSNLRIRGDVGYSPRPLVNRLSGISQKLGSKVEAANLIGTRMRRLEMAERLKPTLDVLRKYKNNFEIQAKLADRKLDEVPEELATAVRSAQEILNNKMADDLEGIGIEIPTRLDNWLPLRVKEYDELQETIRGLQDNPHLLDLDYRTLEQKATPLRRDPKAMQNINKKLEEQRTITKHTPEMMKSYYSLDESLLRYIDEYADQMGRADLFGGRVDIGVEQGIVKLLQEYGSDLTPKKQQEALELIARHFLGEEYVSSPVFKTIQSAIAATLLTGVKTGLAQLLSTFSNLERTGMLNTAEGVAHALRQVLPIGEANKYVNKVSKQILSEVSEKSSVEVLGNYIDFLKDTRYTPLDKAGRMAQDISFSIVKAGDWFEKESTYAANHSWFKRQFKKKKSDELDLFFERYEEGLKQHGITKEQAKEGFLKGEDNVSTIAVMALRSEQRLISSSLDKAAFAIPTDRANEIGSLVANLMTYSLKHAADLSDRTLRMAVQGVKEKDPRKVKLAMKNLLAFAAVLPLYTVFDKSRREGKPTDITVTDMASSALTSTAPMMQRGLRYINENLQGTGDVKDLLNVAIPGSGVPLQLGVDIASDPAGTFDPARNKSFKRMPPGFIFDTLYSFSDQAKVDKQKQLERNSPTQKAMNEYKLAKDAYKVNLPASVLNNPRLARQKITERQQAVSRIKKYGTDDEVQASRNKMIQKALPAERKRFQAAMEAKRGQIGEQRYQELLRQQDEIIIRKLNELMENGKAI